MEGGQLELIHHLNSYKNPKLHYKYYTNIKCPTLVLVADKTIYQDRILTLLNRRRHQGLILHPHILDIIIIQRRTKDPITNHAILL
jgi:hypothetical protein